MTYTDADLERAAHRLCEIRGIDPDYPTKVFSWDKTQWEELVPELRAHLEREQALMDVLLESTNEYINKPADAGEEE